MGLSAKQHEILRKPLNSSRVATRTQGGKQLSYLESFDVRAHLIRTFGYGNFDVELLDYHHVGNRTYEANGKDMVEVIYTARVRLVIRDPDGHWLCTYIEGAGGSASGPATMLGDHHDNALKTAESDAMKRCAVNLGSQFGLSLYDQGSTREVVRGSIVGPEAEPLTDEQVAALRHSLGATEAESTEEKVEA